MPRLLAPVVRDAVLRVVEGPNALAAVAAAQQTAARSTAGGVGLGAANVADAGGNQFQGLELVFVLTALVLDGGGQARGQVRDADGAVGRIHVLAAGARGAHRVDAEFRQG